ncbi:hypothetical protein GEMRC1_001167 [Eukaryota sp. GEM-RC1]
MLDHADSQPVSKTPLTAESITRTMVEYQREVGIPVDQITKALMDPQRLCLCFELNHWDGMQVSSKYFDLSKCQKLIFITGKGSIVTLYWQVTVAPTSSTALASTPTDSCTDNVNEQEFEKKSNLH